MHVNVEIIEFTAGKGISETVCGVQAIFSVPAIGHHILSSLTFSSDGF